MPVPGREALQTRPRRVKVNNNRDLSGAMGEEGAPARARVRWKVAGTSDFHRPPCSAIAPLGGLSLSNEAVFLQLVVEGGGLDPQQARSFGLHPPCFFVRLLNQLPLHILEDFGQWAIAPGYRNRGRWRPLNAGALD